MMKDTKGKAKNSDKKTGDEAAVIAKIDAMKEHYRDMGKRLHEVIMETAPELKPRVWYGMPGYAKSASTPVLLFFRADDSYMTFGLTEKANFALEEGAAHKLMECAWFFTSLDAATEKKVATIVQKALGN